jgi:hypothetical protein
LPDRAPDALLADKGYDADAIRADLASRARFCYQLYEQFPGDPIPFPSRFPLTPPTRCQYGRAGQHA